MELRVHQPSDVNVQIPKIPPKQDEANPRFVSDIEKANPLSKLLFAFAFKTSIRGYRAEKEKRMITSKDLVTFPYNRRPDVLSDKFAADMQRQKRKSPNKKPSLTWAVLRTVKWPLVLLTLIETAALFTRIFSAWVVKKLIDCYTDPNVDSSEPWKWAGILSACLIVAFRFDHYWNHLASYFPNHVQNALINIIFSKITRLSTDSLSRISSGRLINLCTNGVNIFEQLGLFAGSLIVGVAGLIAGAALLWQYFGVYCLVSIGYIVLWYPLQEIGIVASLKDRTATDRATANRIRMTSEAIEAIRLLKMYTWEMKFKDKIDTLRGKEVQMFKSAGIAANVIRGISFSTQVISSFLMFIAYKLSGHELTAGTVFSAYFVLAYLRLYSSFFIGVALIFLTDSKLLLDNIENVLEAPEIGDVVFEKPVSSENVAEFDNYTAYWDAGNRPQATISQKNTKTLINNQPRPDLENVNLNIRKGSLNALVGSVGSGKTTFLMSFTGEIPKTLGSLRYEGSIAYVEQEPTIFAGTFRDNVTFGRPYEPEFYRKVVRACNLENDLKLFAKGDMAEIGEKGNNLSGGQKARLSLARAVYSQADIYLLDDPLSAVDPKVARSIYNNAIEGVLKGKTVLLTTHQVDFARSCENIILMQHGRVLGSGTYEELKRQGIDVDRVFGNSQSKNNVQEEDFNKPVEAMMAPVDKEDKDNQEGGEDKQVKNDQYSVAVTWRTYYGLLREMGGIKFYILLFLVFLTSEFSTVGYGRMLGAWLANTFDQWVSLTVLACLVAYDVIIYVVKYQVLGSAIIRASESYHKKMLDRIIKATVLFFDTNAVGQIINRFSGDIGILDRFIPLAFMDVIHIGVTLLTVTITVGIINPIILGPFAGVIIIVAIIFKFTFPAVKQTKLYELKSKGPLFGLLSATISGLVIIRVYKQAEAFQQRFRDHLHLTMKANNTYNVASRAMTFYGDLTYTLAAIGCVFIITAKASGGDPAQGGIAAFALALVLSLPGALQHGLRQFSQLNISMNAVARIQAYLTVPNEPPLQLPSDESLKTQSWPQKGEIDFHKVYMKYRPDGAHVIKDLSLHVEPGQKIGCVGRTGAGKSTIIQLLYRMQEIDREGDPTNERFIQMDDQNIQGVGLHLLRDSISIIPQTPFIFTGTIRLNVDPLGEFTDEEIWAALEDVRLKQHVESQPRGLDTEIYGGSAVFSAGQKQLVCLARVILKKSNILIMDEATANMDYDTDNHLQKKIAQRFGRATQFTIAHRLQTIADYDKVLVLDRGMKVEFDEPYKLLVKNIGDTQLTNVEGHFAVMVQNTGPISSKKIFEIAREAYFHRHGQQTSTQNRRYYN